MVYAFSLSFYFFSCYRNVITATEKNSVDVKDSKLGEITTLFIFFYGYDGTNAVIQLFLCSQCWLVWVISDSKISLNHELFYYILIIIGRYRSRVLESGQSGTRYLTSPRGWMNSWVGCEQETRAETRTSVRSEVNHSHWLYQTYSRWYLYWPF